MGTGGLSHVWQQENEESGTFPLLKHIFNKCHGLVLFVCFVFVFNL